MPAAPLLVTAPTIEPVSLADARLQLRIDSDHTAEDTWIERTISVARRQAEHETGRKLITQTWDMPLDAFPAGETIALHPELSPVQTIVQIQYRDAAGAWQTLDAAGYALDAQALPARVYLAEGYTWPSTSDDPASVLVRLRCGYGSTAASVPEDIRHWMLMHVDDAYKLRGGINVGVGVTMYALPNRWTDRLLDPYRVYTV